VQHLLRRGAIAWRDESVEAHGPLQDAIDESRATYVLRYTPKGVPDTGWHPITVKVTKPGRYDVRARPGYERQKSGVRSQKSEGRNLP
jgi:hypothetical protein